MDRAARSFAGRGKFIHRAAGRACAGGHPSGGRAALRHAAPRGAFLRGVQGKRPLEARRDARAAEAGSSEDLELLDQDNYHDFIASQGDALVVVDFYTDWCGPCKLVLPELAKMAAYYSDVRFAKYRVTPENKAIADELGIRVAPTFVLYRSSVKVDELKGAKVDRLRKLVQAYRK